MDKLVLNEFLGVAGDFHSTMDNLEGILRHVSDAPSYLRGNTVYHVGEALNNLRALSTIMES